MLSAQTLHEVDDFVVSIVPFLKRNDYFHVRDLARDFILIHTGRQSAKGVLFHGDPNDIASTFDRRGNAFHAYFPQDFDNEPLLDAGSQRAVYDLLACLPVCAIRPELLPEDPLELLTKRVRNYLAKRRIKRVLWKERYRASLGGTSAANLQTSLIGLLRHLLDCQVQIEADYDDEVVRRRETLTSDIYARASKLSQRGPKGKVRKSETEYLGAADAEVVMENQARGWQLSPTRPETPWTLAISELLSRLSIADVDEFQIRELLTLFSMGEIDESTALSAELARLDKLDLATKLARLLWERYPTQAVNWEIPHANEIWRMRSVDPVSKPEAFQKPGRKPSSKVASRNKLIRKIHTGMRMKNAWALLVKETNEHPQFKELGIPDVTRDIVRNVINPPKRRRSGSK